MQNDHDVRVLNGLVETTIDSADGYRRAAEDVHSETLRQMFLDRARERDGVVAELQAQVRTLGGEPETAGSTLATAHRWFMDMRDKLMGGDDKAIINEVERGEDYIKSQFENARGDTNVSQAGRALIERAYVSVRAGHDQMSHLKHGYDAQRV